MRRFAIHYASGEIREGCSLSDWNFVPQTGVTAIAQAGKLLPGGDVYWVDSIGEIWHSNAPYSLLEMIGTSEMQGMVKFGKTVPEPTWLQHCIRLQELMKEGCGCA